MNEAITTVQKQIQLSPTIANYLSQLAQTYQLSENQIIEKAVDLFFKSTKAINQESFFKKELVKLGLLQEVRIRDSSVPPSNAVPMQVPDKPFSEIIIEERR